MVVIGYSLREDGNPAGDLLRFLGALGVGDVFVLVVRGEQVGCDFGEAGEDVVVAVAGDVGD